MKNLFKTGYALKSKALLAIILFAVFQSYGKMKPSRSGYAPVNGTKVYYEVYG